MTSSPSPLTENQFSDVTDAANLSKNKEFSSEHLEDEDEEDEDVDFNPFLKEALSLEASSSISSEIEEFDADVDSGENHSLVANITNTPDQLQDNNVRNLEHNQEISMQDTDITNLGNKDYELNTTTDVTTTVEDSEKLNGESDDEDAIWRRTRARYSLVGSTLDELETFLQETDDEDDLHHNIDDEEEYRKFLAAVLRDEDPIAPQENETLDEDEDNDADFELEIEELLGSDIDENINNVSHDHEHEEINRRPETRQKKRQKTDHKQKKISGQIKLRPILPYSPIINPNSHSLNPNTRNYAVQNTSSAYVSPFTPHQIGQLHCLIYEHVQLLVQVFSLSILEPSRHYLAVQVQRMLSEMIYSRDQVLASERVAYPGFCFNLPLIQSAVTQNTSESTEGSFWVPYISENVLSVIDVAPLNLVRSYLDDVSIVVQDHQERRLEVSYDSPVDKECLFPYKTFDSSNDSTGVSSDSTIVSNKSNDKNSKKSKAAALVERSKKQSIALVPNDIAKLALRFYPLFNPALFPHKPPPVSVVSRVLFTDAEDGLLARGLMRYNTDWKEIQKNFLPCKSPHQIFVRQKNRACSRAPENPIKAVRRMKTSPLAPQEKALIEEGLEVYKLDWMAIWKYMVPHRDPTLLPRQWRTAVGNQKSYKGDEPTKAKRRLYESQRRKSKLEGSRIPITGSGQGWSTEDVNQFPGFPKYKTMSDKEDCNIDDGNEETNSGDEGGNNNEEEEAYVHEAFLSDWRPSSSNEPHHTGSFPLQNNFQQFHHYQIPNKFSKPFQQPFQPRTSTCSRIVKLAPDLPPVNLPPSVRVMSQSDFSKFQDEASSKARENVVHSNRSLRSEKNDSDLQMHPLLFQDPEGSLPYYPLNGSAGSSSSFDFFSNNSPQLNVNLFRNNSNNNNQTGNTLNFFNNSLKSKEVSSLSSGVGFHPLLQRSDDNEPPRKANYSMALNSVPPSPNGLDLDIRLSSTARKSGRAALESGQVEVEHDNGLGNQENGLVEENGNDFGDSGGGLVGDENDEIVMEQEELSDSEDEEMAEESVEFECEEMTDSEGEGGSDSDPVENLQNEDTQDEFFPKVMVQGEDESDEDELRCEETSKSDLGNEKDAPTSSLGINLNRLVPPRSQSKLPVTRNLRNSQPNKSSKNTSEAATTQVKKPRKRVQKVESR